MILIEPIKRAQEAGIIEPLTVERFFDRWEPPQIDPDLKRQATTIKRSPPLPVFPNDNQWIDPGRDTLKQLYQDEGFIHTEDFNENWAYELARFQVGVNEVGIVKYCGTFLEILDTPVGVPVELQPLDPFTISYNGVEAQFILRLDHGTAETFDPDPYVGVDYGVTGYGFNKLPRWSDYRFCWNWTGNHVNWIIPRRHALRLYLVLKPGGEVRLMNKALGRLMGYTQPAASFSAVRNVERGW